MTSLRRIQSEFIELVTNPPDGFTVKLKDTDNYYAWFCTIPGPIDTPYEGGVYKLRIIFSDNYPFKPPDVVFLTRIYHCNISGGGRICLNILQEEWTPAWTITKVLQAICILLTRCNPFDPLEPEIGMQYLHFRNKHDEMARKYTNKYANVNDDK